MATKIIQFGRIIPGLKLHGHEATYPVLNERDARAGAGIMLAFASIAFAFAFFPVALFLLILERALNISHNKSCRLGI